MDSPLEATCNFDQMTYSSSAEEHYRVMWSI